MVTNLTAGEIQKDTVYFSQAKSLEANVKVELDLSNYATKEDLKECSW